MEIHTQVAESTPPSRFRRIGIFSGITVALVVGAALFMFVAHDTEVPSLDDLSGGLRRSSCAETDLVITCYLSAYNLKPGTSNGAGLTHQDPDTVSSSSQLPKWKVKKVSSSSSYYTIKSVANDMYLSVGSTSSSQLTMKSTGSPGNSEQWKLKSTGGDSCGGLVYIQPKNFNNYYLEGGVWYPGLDDSKSSSTKFYVKTASGKLPCGGVSDSCVGTKCKTGVQVKWHADNMADGSAKTKIENDAMKSCNKHCKKCNSWDVACKECGGTIDPITITTSGAYGSSSSDVYYRQCDCNSGIKTAGMSLAAALVVLATVLKLQY